MQHSAQCLLSTLSAGYRLPDLVLPSLKRPSHPFSSHTHTYFPYTLSLVSSFIRSPLTLFLHTVTPHVHFTLSPLSLYDSLTVFPHTLPSHILSLSFLMHTSLTSILASAKGLLMVPLHYTALSPRVRPSGVQGLVLLSRSHGQSYPAQRAIPETAALLFPPCGYALRRWF